jgi:nicotinate phosphoribosyltransferase
MTVFDHQRLTNATLRLDVEGLRRGDYSDKYFENVVRVLEGASADGYRFAGHSPRTLPHDPSSVEVGDLVVEAQIFTRRAPYALIAGIDVALAMIRHVSGYYEDSARKERFVETWSSLEVQAVEDGEIVEYNGQPEAVCPVLKICGRYRDVALLETPILGVLTRASRLATNIYEVLKVSNGKPILFFPARFDVPEVQALDGYAYWLAVQRYNAETAKQTTPLVSTDAQARWWGGRGGGTVPHALIAAFLADTAEAMVGFAKYMPLPVPRIALVDFNNDVVGDSLKVLNAFWLRYRGAVEGSDSEEQQRWLLNGVRLDTSPNTRDVSLDESDPGGVSPKLVWRVRKALDHAWRAWNVPASLEEVAQAYCRNVRIVVTGGFHRDRIAEYEAAGAPVNAYGVGSSLLRNDLETNTDFTMDVVRVRLNDQWVEIAKVGRRANDDPALPSVDLSGL